jgi:hypothetical protein
MSVSRRDLFSLACASLVLVTLLLWARVGHEKPKEPESQLPRLSLFEQIALLQAEVDHEPFPWSEAKRKAVARAIHDKDASALTRALADELLLVVQINPEGRVKVQRGEAEALLRQGQRRSFLLRIENASGGQQLLFPNSRYVGENDNPFQLAVGSQKKLSAQLQGDEVEYRALRIIAKQAGKHELTITIEAGQGSQDLGFRGEAPVLFTIIPSPHATK